MEYGSENVINAIATLVSKVLPVFWPNPHYVEEGRYPISAGEPGVPMVISPDGSCRESVNERAIFAVEGKCPMPGKIFTTLVFYSCPKY